MRTHGTHWLQSAQLCQTTFPTSHAQSRLAPGSFEATAESLPHNQQKQSTNSAFASGQPRRLHSCHAKEGGRKGKWWRCSSCTNGNGVLAQHVSGPQLRQLRPAIATITISVSSSRCYDMLTYLCSRQDVFRSTTPSILEQSASKITATHNNLKTLSTHQTHYHYQSFGCVCKPMTSPTSDAEEPAPKGLVGLASITSQKDLIRKKDAATLSLCGDVFFTFRIAAFTQLTKMSACWESKHKSGNPTPELMPVRYIDTSGVEYMTLSSSSSSTWRPWCFCTPCLAKQAVTTGTGK